MKKAIPIWQPRYHDNVVLVNCNKVSEKENTLLYFCGDINYPNLYAIDYKKLDDYSIGNNGSIYCFEVPLKDLIDLGELPEEYLPLKEKELQKFKKFNSM